MNLFFAPLCVFLGAGLDLDQVEPPRVLHPGLELDLFAREPEIATPIALDVDRRGRVWVIESNTHFQLPGYARHPTDRLLILEDEDHDGCADRFTTFADELHQAMGLALRKGDGKAGGLYLATRREVLLLEDTDGDDYADRTTSLARLETREEYPHNGLSGFAFDDLGFLYFAIGENMGVPYTLSGADGAAVTGGPEGGSIFRMRADGSGLERWALGFWNTFHLTFDDFGRLFAVDNDPDSRPPCRLLHIVRGGDYGYRRWLGRKGLHPFTAWNGEIPGTLPMACGTGEAPSGIIFYEGQGSPPDLSGKLIGTSWGDHRLEVYPLEPRGASFRSRPVPLVAGGEDFRPVGIAAAPDGSIFFSDWVKKDYPVHGKGRVWKLHGKPAAASAGPPPGDEQPRARYRALLALARRGGLNGEALRLALADPAPEIRAAAARWAAGGKGGVPEASLLPLLEDPSPAARLEAILACGREAGPGGADILKRLEAKLADEDPFLFDAAAGALARAGGAPYLLGKVACTEEGGAARRRLGILLALRRTGDPAGRAALPAFLKDPDPDVRRAAFEWVGMERLVEHREGLEAAIGLPPLTRALLDAYLAARGLLAGESPESRDAASRDDFLLDLARDAARAPELRAAALRSLSPAHPKLDEKLLRGLIETEGERFLPLRLEAVRSLRESQEQAAAALLEAVAREVRSPLVLRREAIVGLSRFLPGNEKTVTAFLSDREPLIRHEAERALRLGELPEPAGAREEQGPLDRTALLEGGDPAEGEIIFFHPRGPRCSSCHAVRGRGGEAGPDLSGAGQMPRAKLIDSILEPAKEIAPRYTHWALFTRNGLRAGVIAAEEADGSILLASGDGTIERLAPEDISAREPTSTSLMPDELLKLLTKGEARDLLAFLESLR